MPERPSHLEKGSAVFNSEGREAVAKVMQRNIGDASERAHLFPGAIDAHERLVADA